VLSRWIGVLGVPAFIALAWIFSADRRSVRWRQVWWGVGLQVAIAALLLKVPAVRQAFAAFAAGVQWVASFADVGAARLFGWLTRSELPVRGPGDAEVGVVKVGVVVLLQILPTLIFISALTSVLYHFGVLQRLVQAMAWLMERSLRVSGAEALAVSSNVFLGMSDSPLMIRPYLAAMTASELMAVMVAGFSAISTSMMAVYNKSFGISFDQMLVASIISAPAALYLTKVALPEKEVPATLGHAPVELPRETVNFIDAAASGAATGLTLALNVGAMLLAFAAGLELLNAALEALGRAVALDGPLTLGRILGWALRPAAWLMGVPAAESGAVGELLGIKIALNEYFAYEKMSTLTLPDRTRTIATFALCGFANFGSIAIQLGGIGSLVPQRRRDLARFGIRAMFLGALATIISGTIAGLLLPGG
jgi:concentrative nucleoside transporter, CNT family